MRRLIVFETNEIPLGILRWYADLEPRSAIAAVLGDRDMHATGQTFVSEDLERELYPSQTWATFATGVGYEKHGVYWYGDPKPAEFPLYWQEAARHRTVGICGTLHSSPLAVQGGQSGLRFALPDPFATDSDTLPTRLEPLQRFNLDMTRGNSRAVASTSPIGSYARGLKAVLGSGVSPRTLARLGTMAAEVAAGRVAKERLRTAQFILLGDVFLSQMERHDPDLGVVFTNHVAAFMHRYWPATFPDHWDELPLEQEWIDRFAGEIPFALGVLDRYIDRLLDLATSTDRSIVMLSSMGQVGGHEIEHDSDRVLVLDDPNRFIEALGVDARFSIQNAMEPHVGFRLEDIATATRVHSELSALALGGKRLKADRAGDTVTITYHLHDPSDQLEITGAAGSRTVDPTTIGLSWRDVDAQRVGRHDPVGALVVMNAPETQLAAEPVALEEVAPAILTALGLDALPHHREPSFVIG